ncbi:MAG: 3-isopropylmalate dehydratase small subunit [Candidatus Freyarchaeota archaeon]|nr:3-isopropylmalate dehydratase small subunit [Candidatus Jordarchaeia archaeon]
MGYEETIIGRVVKLGDNIDTDAIILSKYLVSTSPKELGRHVFEGIDPMLPCKIREGDIVVAGKNFGCGSSREHAVLAILGAGIKAIIAESFARIFYRNAINRGLPVIEIPEIRSKIREGDMISINMRENTVTLSTGEKLKFRSFSKEIIKIMKAGGLLEYLKEGIKET